MPYSVAAREMRAKLERVDDVKIVVTIGLAISLENYDIYDISTLPLQTHSWYAPR
jgi:hypothetical protein